MTLEEIRRQIDGIDSKIIGLLSERGRLVTAAGKLKNDEEGVRDPKRVGQVIERARARAAEAGLPPEFAERIYRTIIDCFVGKELQELRDKQDRPVAVYRRTDLFLKTPVPGANMWAVGLEKAMLTYFEMAPDTVFPEHSHEAEQITFVLEGTLTFTYEGEQVTVNPGEVIAIPSNIKHSVRTGSAPCKAVDAWSPVRKEYISG